MVGRARRDVYAEGILRGFRQLVPLHSRKEMAEIIEKFGGRRHGQAGSVDLYKPLATHPCLLCRRRSLDQTGKDASLIWGRVSADVVYRQRPPSVPGPCRARLAQIMAGGLQESDDFSSCRSGSSGGKRPAAARALDRSFDLACITVRREISTQVYPRRA